MYTDHFGFRQPPFSLTPNTDFYCRLPQHQAAFNVLLVGLKNHEGFIKITAEVGSGKTLLCRKLLDYLDSHDCFISAYIPNPELSPLGLYKALAHELGLEISAHTDQQTLQNTISQRLIALHQQQKQVVLVIDEAQVMSTETLETLRLLTNLETQSKKLLQIVLFGQPELDIRLRQHNLRQLRQRISFSHHIAPIRHKELAPYLSHRLATAGYTYGNLFSPRACRLLFRYSQGIPRIINILCHKALMAAYGRNKKTVDTQSMICAIRDSKELFNKPSSKRFLTLGIATILLVVIIIGTMLAYRKFLGTLL